MNPEILALRMMRQHLTHKAGQDEYDDLFRDLQPGLNVYWNGFGNPPSLTHRADFDDMEYNRGRQRSHGLLKLRLIGGNLGWIVPEDLELFAALYRKPLNNPNPAQLQLKELLERGEPMNIQQMKEETGLLVKAITPALHRLQVAFLIYEDQYDGDWDRGWYPFAQMFPAANLTKYSQLEALKVVIQRFAYRCVWFDCLMAKAYYKLPGKEIKAAIAELVSQGILIEYGNGFILKSDEELVRAPITLAKSVFAIHKNDFLYKAHEHLLKGPYERDDWETMYYLLIDGEFRGAAYGKFRYGPPDFPDLAVDLPKEEARARREEIIAAVKLLSLGKAPEKYNGEDWPRS